MSSNTAESSALSAWARHSITAVFQATTPDKFDTAFDSLISNDVKSIVVNGKNMTRDQWKHTLKEMRANEKSAEVKFLGTVETENAEEAHGEVGTFCQVDIAEKAGIVGLPKATSVTMSWNMKIKPDRSLQIPPGAPTNWDFRRVFDMTCVYMERMLV